MRFKITYSKTVEIEATDLDEALSILDYQTAPDDVGILDIESEDDEPDYDDSVDETNYDPYAGCEIFEPDFSI